MAIKIAIFSITEGINCAKIAMQFANYFAGDCKNKTAIVEAGTVEEYKDFYITRPDGIYELNNVFYIPRGTDFNEDDYDIIIKNYSKVNALFTFEEKFDKIYLCEDSNPSNIFEMSDFLTEQNISCDILLFNASKEDLNAYKSYGYACINIIQSDQNICSYEVSLQLSLFLRKKGMEPPEYFKDLDYPDPVFAKDVVLEDEKSKKKGLFSKKTKKEKQQKDQPEQQKDQSEQQKDQPEQQPIKPNHTQQNIESESDSTQEHTIMKANIYEGPNYVNVPAPKPIEISKEEEEKQIAVDKELKILQKTERENKEKRKEQEKKYKEELEQKEREIERLKQLQEEEQQKKLYQQQKEYQQNLIEKEREINALKASREREIEKNSIKDEQYQKEIEELKYKSTHDSLTNVKNRVGFDEDLQASDQFLIIAFDVNDLKFANDTYGHEKGDLLLTTISTELCNIFGADNVYRMGGDEFDVLIRENILQENEVNTRLKKLDKILEKKTKSSKDIIYQVAYGYAYSSEGPVGLVLEAADQRMYDDKKQKKMGREQEQGSSQTSLVETSLSEHPQSPSSTKTINPSNQHGKKFSILEKIQSIKAKEVIGLSGHISIFVTSLRHSCGTSYIAGSLASAMTDLYNRNVWIDHTIGDILPDNIMIKEIATDEDRFNAFKTGIVVFDKGLYKDLSKDDKNEMLRADMNIMVSTADEIDLKNLAAFIRKEGDNANRWLFVFNHVQPNQKATINTIMRNYNHLIIPSHDYSEVPLNVRKDWKNAINHCIASI